MYYNQWPIANFRSPEAIHFEHHRPHFFCVADIPSLSFVTPSHFSQLPLGNEAGNSQLGLNDYCATGNCLVSEPAIGPRALAGRNSEWTHPQPPDPTSLKKRPPLKCEDDRHRIAYFPGGWNHKPVTVPPIFLISFSRPRFF